MLFVAFHREMVWCYFFGLEDEGVLIAPLDLPVIPFTAVQAAVGATEICGPSSTIQEEMVDNSVVALTRREGLFDVLALVERVQVTDTPVCEDAIAGAFLDMLQGTGITCWRIVEST